jgi:hypothetical protein
MKRLAPLKIALAISVCAWLSPLSARANVYATNLRLNTGTNNITLTSPTNITITYRLNEPATLGVTVRVVLGTNILRSIFLTNGQPGTTMGTNSVIWDGRDGGGQPLAIGDYSISVTAGASGYTDWRQISSDINQPNSVWAPRGIAINRNTNSPFYGRVFVANALPGPGPAVGIVKFNADATYAEEGAVSTGGWPWQADESSPWKLEVADDDRVFVSDRTGGAVLSFDQTIASNSLKLVWRSDNAPDVPTNFSGLFVTGSGAGAQLWMADSNSAGNGVGLRRWDIGAGGIVASNDLGVTIIQAGTNSDLDQHPDDLAVDRSNRIYVLQNTSISGDPSARVLRFPAYSGSPETNADWKVGSGDNAMGGGRGLAINPAGTRLAVAFQGYFDDSLQEYLNSSVRIFNPTNGASIATIEPLAQDGPDDYWDVAWDNVGNLYSVHGFGSLWRIFSPPGTNQSTTVAVPLVQVPNPAQPPVLGQPVSDGDFIHFILYGQPGITYVILASSNLTGWAAIQTNTSVFANRTITVPKTGPRSFYRALVGASSPVPPLLTAPSMLGGQFRFNLVGQTNQNYIIQRSSDFAAWIPVVTNLQTAATQQVSVSANGSPAFFRAKLGP